MNQQIKNFETPSATQQGQEQPASQSIWVAIACLSFFPLIYLIGNTLRNWIG